MAGCTLTDGGGSIDTGRMYTQGPHYHSAWLDVHSRPAVQVLDTGRMYTHIDQKSIIALPDVHSGMAA
jgi:hypothetical protein